MQDNTDGQPVFDRVSEACDADIKQCLYTMEGDLVQVRNAIDHIIGGIRSGNRDMGWVGGLLKVAHTMLGEDLNIASLIQGTQNALASFNTVRNLQ